MKKLFVSTACLKGDKNYNRVLDTYIGAGIKNIELTGVHPYLQFDKLKNLINEYKLHEVDFTFHNYYPPPEIPIVLNMLSQNKKDKDDSKKIITDAVKLAKLTNTKVFAFHPGYLREADVNEKGYFKFKGEERISFDEGLKIYRDDFFDLYNSLKIGNDISIGLENLFPNEDGTNDSFMCTFEEINKLFSFDKIKDINLFLLLDLGHLAISSNLLNFDRYDFIEKCIDNFGDKILEIHISNNDEKRDLHSRITKDCWQLDCLKNFINTGPKPDNTIFTYESRGLTIEEIKDDCDLIKSSLN
tara:strand:- start:526 stop:1428 length:903 start_codon:yes stop_codon:yes gene_type:complete